MNTTTMNKDQIAAEALERFEKAVETDGPPLDQFERSQFLESVKAAIKKATKPKDEALLKIFEWARRNAPYPECKIEGNTLLQDICEQGLGYWPASRAGRASEQE